ncbi:MAG TPA: hypothetical protein VNB24_04050, partial [Acidimicrobiales bacterium]|nr:hypothetical protein [Acidimicrobiales bacterium]
MFRGTTLKSAIALVATLALLAAGASIVRADSVDADGDTLETGNNITASCLTETDNGVLKLTYDSTGSNPKHYVAGTALTISSVVTNAGGSAITSAASNSTNNVAAIWNADGQTMTIPITTVVPANTPGGTYKVDYTVAGAGAGGGTVSRSRHFNVTVTCTPPSNTAPTVSVTGVTSGASYNKGSVPAAVCSVTDAQDGPSTFPATLSAITGPYAADGIGSQTASCSYTDAGPGPLSDTDSVSYNIVDSSAPVITPTVTGTKGSLDWYTSDVTVQWTVTDAQSTVAIDSGCAPSTTFTADTTGVTSSCTAHSAGGSASDSVTVKLDKTAPTGVALAPSGTAGVAPWFTSNVEVITNGTDATSGVSCTDSQPFSAETSGTTVNGFCTNGAGLTTNASPLTLKIDKTGPSAELNVTDGTPGGTNGWYTSDV